VTSAPRSASDRPGSAPLKSLAGAVRVLPDVPAIDRAFDYLVPAELGDQVRIGSIVRITLSGRRVRGWVLAGDGEPPGLQLSTLDKLVGAGPDEEMIDLCRWTAWRWAGRLATILRLASPQRSVGSLPPLAPRPSSGGPVDQQASALLATGSGTHVMQVAPTTDPLSIALAATSFGQALVVIPSVGTANAVHAGLRRHGASVARWPDGWPAAAGGASVVGGRSAVFAPMPALCAVVVIDEHDEMLQNESSPTWNAREVAIERAGRAGVPCLLVSPCPSLEARGSAEPTPRPLARALRVVERSGWSPVTVIDRRGEDTARSGLFSSRLVEAVRSTARSGQRVLCVLNRTGRARLMVCRSCGTVARCDACGSSVTLGDDLRCHCPNCGESRPGVCLDCASSALAALRLGVTRAREELEALALEPVASVTGADPVAEATRVEARIVIGTEAVLHRFDGAGLVAFPDFDQELLAPRYRAAEEALGLLVLASRLLGGRSRGGRVLLQTRLPEHEVVRAALQADPGLVASGEAERRRMLRFPPYSTLAVVGGEGAAEYVERIGGPVGVEVLGPTEGQWLLRAEQRSALLDHFAVVARPAGRLRLQVDPARIR
jgi:primosomal protein N' (replication factor Y) (superfamily II helicase)